MWSSSTFTFGARFLSKKFDRNVRGSNPSVAFFGHESQKIVESASECEDGRSKFFKYHIHVPVHERTICQLMTNDLYFVNLRSLIAFLYIAVNEEDVMDDINDGRANGRDEQMELPREESEEKEQPGTTSVETGDSDI